MAFKFIVIAALIACSQASLSPLLSVDSHLARLAPEHASFVTSEGSNPAYEFKYGVHDSFTGDSKSAHEVRNGDLTVGTYSLNDADGTRRTVDYTATPHTGFQATVRKEPLHETHITAAPIPEPALPIVEHIPAPEPTFIAARTSTPFISHVQPAPLFAAPQLLRSFSYPSASIARSGFPLSYAAPLHYQPITFTRRNDAGLYPDIVSPGLNHGILRSYPAAPTLIRSW